MWYGIHMRESMETIHTASTAPVEPVTQESIAEQKIATFMQQLDTATSIDGVLAVFEVIKTLHGNAAHNIDARLWGRTKERCRQELKKALESLPPSASPAQREQLCNEQAAHVRSIEPTGLFSGSELDALNKQITTVRLATTAG